MYDNVVSQFSGMMIKLLTSPRYRFSQASSNDVPRQPGVYAIWDRRVDQVTYVGRARSLRRRLLSDHKKGNVEGSQFRKALGGNFGLDSEKSITSYILGNCGFHFMIVEDPAEGIGFEHFTTPILAPVLNINLR